MRWPKDLSWIKEWAQPIAIVVGGIWIGGIWLYHNVHLPSLVQEHVTIDAKASVIDRSEDFTFILLEAEIFNSGKKPAFNANNSINVYAYTVHASQDGFTDAFIEETIQEINTSLYPKLHQSHAQVSSPELVAFGNFMVRPERFEPNERHSVQQLLQIPKGFDFVEIEVEVITSHKRFDCNPTTNCYPKYKYRELDDGRKRIGIDREYEDIASLQRSKARTIVHLAPDKANEANVPAPKASESIN